MKKYVKPIMESESFVANEYIGACYIIKCNMSDGDFIPKIYLETNGQSGLQRVLFSRNPDTLVNIDWESQKCDEYHDGIIRAEQPESNGYYVNETWDGSITTNVYVWRGKNGKYHVSDLTQPGAIVTNTNAS